LSCFSSLVSMLWTLFSSPLFSLLLSVLLDSFCLCPASFSSLVFHFNWHFLWLQLRWELQLGAEKNKWGHESDLFATQYAEGKKETENKDWKQESREN
jgi:hypothetical protein